ncbi:hypothetical protein PISMIDRAFT_109874, partial [Pisolithus microcarpus 441]
SAFQEVAIQWLIKTDQPINVLQNLMFMQIINIASCTHNNVKIPNHKQIHQAIIDLFKSNLHELCKQLQVCIHII